ncbi:hypothetical protein AC52_4119 [Escherichia coli 5-366-08_S3_C3]|nr:hypothetical protein AB41_4754 [Escherichia coli 1-250-04_S1_C2]KDX26270.1 hypothetical protein AB13_4349 [Escherichia coli 1-250-04_S1_C1]KEL72745.1 hypothetical protein AC52_4119 [Escherichia coli 5-366-08_S3_C3]KEL90132.1 hypothetical protein AB94_4055 [Escherichia coli 5-366-08_S3_C1]
MKVLPVRVTLIKSFITSGNNAGHFRDWVDLISIILIQ